MIKTFEDYLNESNDSLNKRAAKEKHQELISAGYKLRKFRT